MAVITVSRQYGSGGDEVATRVSILLGYRCFDKSVIAEVAAAVGLASDEVADVAEERYRAPGLLNALNHALYWTETLTGGRHSEAQALDESERVSLVEGILRMACKQGDMVILGRAGQAVLQGVPNVMHVRIQAPLDLRTERVSQQEHISSEAARERIAERDAAAAEYVRRFYKVDWADPMLYHLVLNTGHWDLENAARVIAAAAHSLPISHPAGPEKVAV
jgi:CMP/dCMP kinase